MKNNTPEFFGVILFLITFVILFLCIAFDKISKKHKIFSLFKNIFSAIFLILFVSCFVFIFAMAELSFAHLISLVFALLVFTGILINPELVLNFMLRSRKMGNLTISGEGIKMWRGTALLIMIIVSMGILIYFMRYIWGYGDFFNEFIGELSGKILLKF